MAPLSGRPWALVLLAVLVVAGAGALVGWQARWPTAVFGARKAAVIRPVETPATSQAPASPPYSLTPSSVAAVGGPAGPGSTAGPASVVDAYFAAINARNYATAWKLGGSNSGSSYAEFVSGFAPTSHDTVTILSTSGDVVTARLVAQQDDGSTKTFEGTYTVSGQVITSFDVRQTG